MNRILILLMATMSLSILSSIEYYYPKQLNSSSTSYGITGLMTIPNARFMEEGSMKIGFSNSYPNKYTFITATPFEWFEASYRYSEQKNVLYGPASYSGNQTLKDKGFDFKLKLIKESYYIPQIALGMNDIAGTAKFSAEYLSLSKRLGDIDLTVGIGWGYLGQDSSLRNPFLSLDEDFRTRNSQVEQGGDFNTKDFFSGENISIFSGIEYYINKYGLVFKAEYDTSNPDIGKYAPKIPVSSRFNFGIVRPVNKNFDIGLSFERGNQWRLAFSIKSDYGRNALVQKNDKQKNVIKLNNEQSKKILQDKQIFYRSLNRSLREESLYIQGATLDKSSVEVVIAQNRFRSYPRAIGRTARIVSALSPDSVETIKITPMNGDTEVYSMEIDRNKFDKLDKNKVSKSELLISTKIYKDKPDSFTNSDFEPRVKFPEHFFNMSPSLRHQIGGPEAFYLGQIWWKIDSKIKFSRGLTLQTVLGLDIYNNFDEFANPSYSEIPHVRSDIQEYLAEGKNNIARLKLDYIWSPTKNTFARIDIGYLEEMFGGVGGEIYYRPFNSNISASLQVHKVRQRSYDQKFDFRDYEAETGHLGIYFDLVKGIHAQLLMGKYLAGDKGVTVDLSRRFNNGFTLGIFATKTNLSSKEFGEGSFDKGFYFSIPTDLFFTNYRQGDISFGLHPLTKDGGAILNHSNSLHSLYGDTTLKSVLRDWRSINE